MTALNPTLAASLQTKTDHVFLNQLYRQIAAAWQDTREEMVAAGYAREIIYYQFAQTLRARVDHRLMELGSAYSKYNIRMEPTKNKGAYFALIDLPHAKLTTSAVRRSTNLPRDAHFRNQLARLQTSFDIDPNVNALVMLNMDDGAELGVIYAVVLHGPKKHRRHELGFVDIAFLDADGVYLEDRLHLPDLDLETEQEIAEAKDLESRIELALQNNANLGSDFSEETAD